MSETVPSCDNTIADDTNPNPVKNYIHEYLCSRSDTFRKLAEIRIKGWGMVHGHKTFHQQRELADMAPKKMPKKMLKSYFRMHKEIGAEMDQITGAMKLKDKPKILDLCMAPGGYTTVALKLNPGATVSGATLPEVVWGYNLMLAETERPFVHVCLVDLTMLVGDMGVDISDIPEEHADFKRFQKDEEWPGEKFDLVFCDGQVISKHSDTLAVKRQRCEQTRLTCSQLLITLRHVTHGGMMVLLLHKVEAWNSLMTIRAFDRFAEIQLYKPSNAHESENSFYLVAKNIQPDHPAALEAVQEWAKSWKDATIHAMKFEDQADAMKGVEGDDKVSEQQVAQVLDDFGVRLISLGKTPWKIQLDGLKNNWFKQGKAQQEAKQFIDLSSHIEKMPLLEK